MPDQPTLDSDILHAVTELYYDYAEAADAADPQAFAQLFTDDCRFDGGPPQKGRDRIAKTAGRLLSMYKETSHHISQIRVRTIEGDQATATAYVYAWHRLHDDNTFVALARYRSTVRLDGGRWRFCSHDIVLAAQEGGDGRDFLRLPRADLSAFRPA